MLVAFSLRSGSDPGLPERNQRAENGRKASLKEVTVSIVEPGRGRALNLKVVAASVGT